MAAESSVLSNETAENQSKVEQFAGLTTSKRLKFARRQHGFWNTGVFGTSCREVLIAFVTLGTVSAVLRCAPKPFGAFWQQGGQRRLAYMDGRGLMRSNDPYCNGIVTRTKAPEPSPATEANLANVDWDAFNQSMARSAYVPRLEIPYAIAGTGEDATFGGSAASSFSDILRGDDGDSGRISEGVSASASTDFEYMNQGISTNGNAMMNSPFNMELYGNASNTEVADTDGGQALNPIASSNVNPANQTLNASVCEDLVLEDYHVCYVVSEVKPWGFYPKDSTIMRASWDIVRLPPLLAGENIISRVNSKRGAFLARYIHKVLSSGINSKDESKYGNPLTTLKVRTSDAKAFHASAADRRNNKAALLFDSAERWRKVATLLNSVAQFIQIDPEVPMINQTKVRVAVNLDLIETDVNDLGERAVLLKNIMLAAVYNQFDKRDFKSVAAVLAKSINAAVGLEKKRRHDYLEFTCNPAWFPFIETQILGADGSEYGEGTVWDSLHELRNSEGHVDSDEDFARAVAEAVVRELVSDVDMLPHARFQCPTPKTFTDGLRLAKASDYYHFFSDITRLMYFSHELQCIQFPKDTMFSLINKRDMWDAEGVTAPAILAEVTAQRMRRETIDYDAYMFLKNIYRQVAAKMSGLRHGEALQAVRFV